MGGPEGQAMLNGFIPNGLLPNEATSVARVLDPERWSRIEERTTELIAHIQPNKSSEGHRNAVASYVQRLIKKCFSCEVFTFGSVPLKTYLPDGDIDLTAFSNNQTLMDSWADEVCNVLKCEERSEDAEFCVKEVHYIQAEVKIVKCIVENIVVDISFNQLGGLCTLCFLGEVDDLISQDHLFKRSIILIKAWCYYESRILGAHHGLISTYALETLVLYIFHIYNNKFAGPLEVLYRFLEFFSKFDWNNYCLSLWGPVPISSLPDMRAEPPLKDGGELLLSKVFLDSCGSVYTAIPGSQEHQGQPHQGQPFISKYFNIIDPLRANNNLGRSVSKGNFFRIKSAFAFGAQQLVWLLDCPEENLIAEFDLFFRNTWDRHGKGHRPDAPNYIICSKNKEVTKNSKCHEFKVEGIHTSHAENTERGNGHFSSSKIHSNKKLSLRSKVSNHYSSSKNGNNKKLSLRSKVSNNHSDRVSAKNKKSSWRTSSHWRSDYADDSENACDGEFGLGFIEEDGLSVEKAMWIHQEEQDFVNRMMTWGYPNFNSYVEAPVNANYTYIPFYMLPPTLTSGYLDADSFGMLPANVPFESFWGHNMTSIQGDLSKAMWENLVVSEFYLEDGNGDEWPELNVNLVRGYGYEDGGIQAQQQKDGEALASVGYSSGYSSCQTSSGSYSSKDYGETIKNGWLTRENYGQDPLDERTIEIDENSTSDSFTPATYSMDSDAEPGSHHAGQLNVNLDSTWSPKLSDTLNMPNYIRHDATLECLEKEKFDIFKGDFSSHWKNLQYGRLCQQRLEFRELLPYPPSFVVPPIYLQGQYPCDGYGAPATNMSSHIIPMAPVQNGSESPTDINQCFTRELPTFRGGTGTYFPNPTSFEKFFRQRQYANYRNRRRNHLHDRRDHHGERERNRNFNSKPSFSGHNHYRCQVYRPVIRMDRTDLGKRGPEKQWNSFEHGFFSSYNYCNGSFKSSVSNSHISDNVPYGMHPLSVVGSSEISLSETANPPVSMRYPYDPNISNTSSNLPEFGSFGPVQFSGTSRALHRGESSHTVVDVEANFEGCSPDSSPNYPSSYNF